MTGFARQGKSGSHVVFAAFLLKSKSSILSARRQVMLEPRSCASIPQLPIPDTYHSGLSCVAPSTFTRFPTCCLPYATSYQANDQCFQWCHTHDDWYLYKPSTWPLGGFDVGNSTVSNATERLRLSFKACLAADGQSVTDDVVSCQANTQATVPSDYNFFGPNNITCDLRHPSTTLNLQPNHRPQCAIRPTGTGTANTDGNNTATFDRCCGWAPRKWDSSHCYVYCELPRGNAFRGDGNLTADESLGSFKKCMINNGGGEVALDGIYCAGNDTMIDIKAYNVTTAAYLDGSSSNRPKLGWTALGLLTALVLMGTVSA